MQTRTHTAKACDTDAKFLYRHNCKGKILKKIECAEIVQ
jgi:hypothetical protein